MLTLLNKITKEEQPFIMRFGGLQAVGREKDEGI
jgi:hypothetical protein